MAIVTTGMTSALQGLDRPLDAPRREGMALGNWRWTVRQRMTTVRDALIGETSDPDDGWLAARGGTAFRERNVLLGRMIELGPLVLESPDVEAIRLEVKRLLADIGRHMQRLNDLAYDEVELELGGSECRAGTGRPIRPAGSARTSLRPRPRATRRCCAAPARSAARRGSGPRSGPIARRSSVASRCFSQGPDDGTSSVSTASSGTNTESPGGQSPRRRSRGWVIRGVRR